MNPKRWKHEGSIASGSPSRFEWFVILSGLVIAFAIMALKASAQIPPPVPSFAQPQPQAAIIVPRQVHFPWLRYNVLGWRQPFEVYTPIGAPFQATVQPVVRATTCTSCQGSLDNFNSTPVAPVGVAR